MNWRRLNLIFQAYLFRFSFFVFFLLFLSVFGYAYYIEAQREDMGVVAPFSDVDPSTITQAEVADDKAHRTRREMQAWVLQTVSEIFYLNPNNQTSAMRDNAQTMSPAALRQLNDYLASSGLKKTIEGQNMQLSAIVDEMPLLLNEGAINGTYRWLFDVPALLALAPYNARELVAQNSEDTRAVTLRVQVGRAPSADNPDAMIIESLAVNIRQ